MRSRRDGTRIYYCLAGHEVGELWATLRGVAEVLRADLDRLASSYLGDQHGVETLGRDELLGRLAAGEVTLLDVRPRIEYRAGHIPGRARWRA